MTIVCPICNEGINTKGLLQKHFDIKHKEKYCWQMLNFGSEEGLFVY